MERKGGTGEGRQPPWSPHAQENTNAQKTLTKTPTKLLQRPMDQEDEESSHMRISNKPLTAKVKLVLLVVNSIKDSAYYCYLRICSAHLEILRFPNAGAY